MDRILGLKGHAAVYSRTGQIENYDQLAVQIASIPGVLSVTPQIEGQAMLVANGTAPGAAIRGLRPSELKAKSLIADHLVGGSLDRLEGGDEVIVGDRLALAPRLGVGDKGKIGRR